MEPENEPPEEEIPMKKTSFLWREPFLNLHGIHWFAVFRPGPSCTLQQHVDYTSDDDLMLDDVMYSGIIMFKAQSIEIPNRC